MPSGDVHGTIWCKMYSTSVRLPHNKNWSMMFGLSLFRSSKDISPDLLRSFSSHFSVTGVGGALGIHAPSVGRSEALKAGRSWDSSTQHTTLWKSLKHPLLLLIIIIVIIIIVIIVIMIMRSWMMIRAFDIDDHKIVAGQTCRKHAWAYV